MELIAAVEKGDSDEVLRLLAEQRSRQELTASNSFSLVNVVPLFQFVHAIDACGNSALHRAAARDHYDVLRVLLDHGADPNQRGRLGFTPLHMATQHSKDKKLMQLLVARGANVLSRADWGATILHAAATTGNIEGMEFALEQGVNVDAKGFCKCVSFDDLRRNGRFTALHNLASRCTDATAFEFLKAKGAKPGATDSGGWNILHHGARNQNATAIKFGLESHVSIHDRTNSDKSVLEIAREYGSDLDVLKLIYATTGEEFSVPPTPSSYPLTHDPKGLLVIINNRKFMDSDFDLPAADKLGRTLRRTFAPLGFEVIERQDLSPADILHALEFARDRVRPEHDLFVCAIMSHGHLGEIVGYDGAIVQLHQLVSLFTENNCLFLRDKPKLFFIDACQGDAYWSVNEAVDAVDVTFTAPDSIQTGSNEDHFFFGFATQEGYVSWRDREIGSLYIHTLCQLLLECGGEDIHEIHRKVEKKVVEIGKQTPQTKSTLRKKLCIS